MPENDPSIQTRYDSMWQRGDADFAANRVHVDDFLNQRDTDHRNGLTLLLRVPLDAEGVRPRFHPTRYVARAVEPDGQVGPEIRYCHLVGIGQGPQSYIIVHRVLC